MPPPTAPARDRVKHAETQLQQLPEPYQQERPSWRPPLHPAAPQRDVPDLFTTKPNQPEDDMSQLAVRKGFTARNYVRNEALSAHDSIYSRLQSPAILRSLSSWMDEVAQRRHELDRAHVAASQYKPPSRVTLNDAKLANYVKDLADPNVPLTRLSRNVPHGFRGEKLFEMLWAGGALPATVPAASSSSTTAAAAASAATRRSVEISRAVWFIRALGAAELSSLRNKSAATIVPEITSNLCTWMAKQVAELNIAYAAEASSSTAAASPAPAPAPAPASPSTHVPRTPGSAAASAALSRSVAAAHFARTPSNLHAASSPSPLPSKEVCTVLQNHLDQERWIAKWSYSLSLARHLHAQHLLDRSILVRWIVDAFAASNLVQLPLLVELVQEVIVLILRRRCFVRPFLAALLAQITALDARFDRASGGAALRNKLLLLFRIVCESSPDTLTSPRLWCEHAASLVRLLNELKGEAELDPSAHVPPNLADFVELNIRPRVDRLLLQPCSTTPIDMQPDSPSASQSHQHHLDIHALDSFDMKTIDRVFLQTPAAGKAAARLHRDDAAWTARIETILTWACTERRRGVARQYLAATLIEKIRFGVGWEESSEETDKISLPAFDLEHPLKKTRKINVEPMLIKWLGDVEAALNSPDDALTSDPRAALLATTNVSSLVVLIGELARRGVFSYTKYLQRLIARGMTTTTSAPSATADPAATATVGAPNNAPISRDSLHLRVLRSLPLYDQPASVFQQRRQAIYGERTKETYEDAAQRRALRQLQCVLPFAFASEEVGAMADAPTTQTTVEAHDLQYALSRLWSASRFVRCKIFRSELLPAISSRIDVLSGEELSLVSAILVMGDDFESLAQLLATLLLRPLSDSLARPTFNMVIEFSLVWRSMDIMGTLNQLVRQQLNHSSSVRNDRQAVMASTTLLRLRTLIEGVPSRLHAAPHHVPAEHDAIQAHVQALRPNVVALLLRLTQRTEHSRGASDHGATTSIEGSEILTPFRSLFLQPDGTSDEITERAIVQSVLQLPEPAVVDAAVRLIDQLYLEASLEIDERHARWLGDLAQSMEHGGVSHDAFGALLSLLSRLVAHGTLNLQLMVDTFLLPYLLTGVTRLTDPAMRNQDSRLHVGAVVACLRHMFSGSLGDEGDAGGSSTYEDQRAFGAQTVLLFAPVNLPSLVKMATSLICASGETSSLPAGDKVQVEAFWRALLTSERMQLAFRQDARVCMLSVRDTCKALWGCHPAKVMDAAMACLDATSLLLGELGSIDAGAVRARLNEWDTRVVANELVEIFERLQLVEPSFQSRADTKTRALAAGIFDELFLRLPHIGAQLMRDCRSAALVSRFVDIGIKILADRIKAQTGKHAADAAVDEVGEVLDSLLRMCRQQEGFTFNATDADSCGHVLLHVIHTLEAASTQAETCASLSAAVSSVLHDGVTMRLLHLVLRFGCLWNGAAKAGAARLIKVLVRLAQHAGSRIEGGGAFTLLVDTLSFVLDEMPAALVGWGEVEMQLQQAQVATPERMQRLQALSYVLDSGPGRHAWMVAPSARAALGRGWFAPGALNPWECAEYLDPPPPTQTSSGAHHLTQGRGARFGWPDKLTLNTAVAPSLLALRVTRDVVPHYASPSHASSAAADRDEEDGAGMPMFVESERTYGARTAGEPLFARDLRRGVLALPLTAAKADKTVDVIDLTFDDDDAAPVVRAEVPRKRRLSKRD